MSRLAPNHPLISIIVPFHNRAAYLQRTLLSIFKQNYHPVELILIDNNSTDDSMAVCESLISAAPFPIQITKASKQGASAARNEGVKLAQGKYLFFFDSDDEMSEDFLSDALPFLESNDIVAAPTKMIFANGASRCRKVYPNASVTDQILTGMLSTQGMIIRKAFFIDAGGWNEDLPKWNDWELGVRLLLHRPRIHWLSKSYHRIYQHEDSLTGPSLAKTIRQIMPAINAVNQLPLSSKEQQALEARKVILAAELAREGKQDEATQLYKGQLKWLYLYTKTIHKGAWWLYRSFHKLFH